MHFAPHTECFAIIPTTLKHSRRRTSKITQLDPYIRNVIQHHCEINSSAPPASVSDQEAKESYIDIVWKYLH
jgi:hypothetical protein